MLKTKIILVIVTFLINGMVYSQTNKPETKKDIEVFEKDSIRTNVYTINLCSPDQRSVSNNSLHNRLSLKNKNLLSIILKNCNPNKYIYRINSEPVAFNTDASEFKQLIDSVKKTFFTQSNNTTETTKSKEVKELAKFTAEIKDNVEKRLEILEKKAIPKTNIIVDSLKKEAVMLNDKYSAYQWYDQPSDYLDKDAKRKAMENAEKMKMEILKQKLMFAVNDILKFEKYIIKNNVTREVKNVPIEIEEIQSLQKKLKEFALEDSTKVIDAINDEFYKIVNYMNEEHTLSLTALNFISSQMEGECIQDTIKDSVESLKKLHLQNVILYSKFKSLYNYRKLSNTFIDDEIAKGVNMESVITTTLDNYSKLNTQVSPPFPVSSNLTNIDLIRVKIERIDKSTQLSKDVTYDFWLKGGFKIDFSAGIFATSLRDDEFYFKSDPTNSGNKAIFKKDNGQYNFGFGSMMNVMLRTGASWITPGLSIGAIFTAQQKFQILTGLSVAIGKQERIVLHGGVAIGFAKRLDNNYETTSLGKEKYYDFGENSTLVPTDDRFKSKVFWGITYNISGGSPFKSIGK